MSLAGSDRLIRESRRGEEAVSKIVVSQFVTLDGVFEDPGGSESHEHGGWALQIDRGPEGDKFKLDEVMGSDALLLGRVTYEGFAAAWPSQSDEQGFADRMNSLPKFVASTTLSKAEWQNSTVLQGDAADEVTKLKEDSGRDILVAGSRQLVQTLAKHDLVDEYRLLVYPIVLGSGKRLFEESTHTPLRLRESRSFDSGVVLVSYEPAREA
jgi:dihydrofolate reductase